MTRNRRLLWIGSAAVAAVWVGLVTAVLWANRHLNRDAPTRLAQPTADITPLWPAPPFSFPDQNKQTVTDATLHGHPYVADFFFSTCTTACPTLTAKLSFVRQKVTSADVRFVSFSVDPAHDTPATLKAYAAEWGEADPRWHLLVTTPPTLDAVARGFKVTVAPSGDPSNPILHSTLFVLVDADGQVRGIYDSTDDAQVDKIARDLTGLAGATPPPAPELLADAGTAVNRGRQVYAAMSCAACHARAEIAPPLASLTGSMVRLADGSTVWADDAYLHESITHPAAKIVAGYLNAMPSYRSHLTDGQTADLVAYIDSMSANPPGGHGLVSTKGHHAVAPAAVVVDPVCHMKVAANPSGQHATFDGRTFHFCSAGCRDRFLADPVAFATSAPATRP